jgi:hypothetical protein
MKRTIRYCVQALALVCVLALFSSVAMAQGTFTLGFEGPNEFSGNAGDVFNGQTYFCTLTQADVPPPDPADPIHNGFGAQGWSLSMTAEGAAISAITTAGTASDKVDNGGYWEGGFNKTQLSTKAGAGSQCEGKNGAVSAVVLSFTSGNVLPLNQTYQVAKLTVDGFTIPAGGGSAKMLYADGCQGAGQPVQVALTQGGNTVTPDRTEKIIALREAVTCCGKSLNVGFSAEKVRSDSVVFEGIVGDTTLLCGADGGEIDVAVLAGEKGAGSVFVNVVSDLPTDPEALPPNLGGAQGWSLSIAVDGMGVKTATTVGTASDTVDNGGYWEGGFNKTQVIDPAKNAGQQGAVSAVVLSFTTGATLPNKGTQTVLALSVEASENQGDADQTGTVKFKSGLVGAGQPVQNALTVGGATESACNFGTASVKVVFKKAVITDHKFIRGNPNNDGKVNIADPIWIINELFRSDRNPPATVCKDAADANNDGTIDASDALYLIHYQFTGGPQPPAPFGECGFDPEGDADGLPCAADQIAICTIE